MQVDISNEDDRDTTSGYPPATLPSWGKDHRPLIFDAIQPLTSVLAAFGIGGQGGQQSSSLLPPPSPFATVSSANSPGDASASTSSPRRRENSTPISPFHTITGAQLQHNATQSAATPIQTPTPTPPAGQPLSLPTYSQSASPTGTSLSPMISRPLFFYSPSEVEPIRHSQRSGRVLSELESLHQKHESEFKVIVPAIGNALKCTVDAHEKRKAECEDPAEVTDDRMAYFDTVAAPSISVQQYVKRVADFTYVSPSTLLSSVILMDRLLDRFPKLHLTLQNVFKVFFVSVRIASKVLDLRSLNNKNFASVGGVSNKHLNDLEAKMLMDLRFDLFIPQDLFVKYARRLMPSPIIPMPLGRPVTGGATSPRAARSLTQVTFAPPPPLNNNRRSTYQAGDGAS